MSYNGKIDFGLIGDYDAMSDLDSLALDLEVAIGELVDAVPKRRRRSKSPRTPKPATAKAGNGARPSSRRRASAQRDG